MNSPALITMDVISSEGFFDSLILIVKEITFGITDTEYAVFKMVFWLCASCHFNTLYDTLLYFIRLSTSRNEVINSLAYCKQGVHNHILSLFVSLTGLIILAIVVAVHEKNTFVPTKSVMMKIINANSISSKLQVIVLLFMLPPYKNNPSKKRG